MNLATRWIAGCGLHEALPDHSSLTRIRQRWGAERFRAVFARTVQTCVAAGIAKGEVVHTDSSLIRADVANMQSQACPTAAVVNLKRLAAVRGALLAPLLAFVVALVGQLAAEPVRQPPACRFRTARV